MPVITSGGQYCTWYKKNIKNNSGRNEDKVDAGRKLLQNKVQGFAQQVKGCRLPSAVWPCAVCAVGPPTGNASFVWRAFAPLYVIHPVPFFFARAQPTQVKNDIRWLTDKLLRGGIEEFEWTREEREHIRNDNLPRQLNDDELDSRLLCCIIRCCENQVPTQLPLLYRPLYSPISKF